MVKKIADIFITKATKVVPPYSKAKTVVKVSGTADNTCRDANSPAVK